MANGTWALLALALVVAAPAAATNHLIVIDEVLGSWQGDDAVQFVELRMLAPGQRSLSDGGGSRGAVDLVFDDASGSAATRRVFTFTRDQARGEAGARVLVGTAALRAVAGVEPDFVLPPGVIAPRNGRVCYRVNPPQAPPSVAGVLDCVAYGRFAGDNGPFGRPTPLTPDNRALRRVALTGGNVADWRSALEPTPENNAGHGAVLRTLCGDGLVSQGEECDGTALAGKTCASLGFAGGRLRCRECHLDASRCTFCGNDAINPGEQCDGTDLGGRTCGALGFTGGALACTDQCRLSTRGCDPTFFVPGGGPRRPECLAAWQVTNAGGRPGPSGRAPARQRCRDGDPGCDADTVAGTCTFAVGVCLNRDDARLARRGRPCLRTSVEAWTLEAAGENGGGADALAAAVAALGDGTGDGGTVTFAPALDATERCTAAVPVTVATRGRRAGRLRLRSRTTAAGGRPRDRDGIVLVCGPR